MSPFTPSRSASPASLRLPRPSASLAWSALGTWRWRGAHRQPLAAENAQRAYADVAEFAYDAMVGVSLGGVVRSWNHAAVRLFGHTAAQAIGRNISLLAAPGLADEQADLMKNALAGRIAAPIETVHRRRDGTMVCIELSMMPIRDAMGAIVALVMAARDISARKQAEAHRALLAEELTHRVKNTLATVQSVAMHSLNSAASLEDFRVAFDARLGALSAAHSLLTRSAWKGATLFELIDIEITPYLRNTPAVAKTSGVAVDLNAAQALSLGMVLHELATNASKYGAFSVPEGRVHISWEICVASAGPRLKIAWRESGGPPVAPPARQGFGTRLVTRSLAHELNGEVHLSFPASGVICEIDIPLHPDTTA